MKKNTKVMILSCVAALMTTQSMLAYKQRSHEGGTEVPRNNFAKRVAELEEHIKNIKAKIAKEDIEEKEQQEEIKKIQKQIDNIWAKFKKEDAEEKEQQKHIHALEERIKNLENAFEKEEQDEKRQNKRIKDLEEKVEKLG